MNFACVRQGVVNVRIRVYFPLYFFRQSLSLSLEVIDWLCWLTSDSPGPTSLPYQHVWFARLAIKKRNRVVAGTQLSVWLVVPSLGTKDEGSEPGLSL